MNLEDVILRSTRALQPAATAVAAGTIYFVTDELVLERSSGSAWQTYSGVLAKAITYAMIQDISASPRLLGRATAGAGVTEEIALGSGLSITGTTLNNSEWTTTVVKSGDQDVINSTTLVNDTELKIAVLTGEVWFFELFLLYGGDSATADYKCNFALPTVSGWHRYIGDNNVANAVTVSTGIRTAGVTAFAASIQLGADASGTTRVFFLEMMLRAAANGDVQFQFAQNTLTAAKFSRTKLGSILRGKKLV